MHCLEAFLGAGLGFPKQEAVFIPCDLPVGGALGSSLVGALCDFRRDDFFHFPFGFGAGKRDKKDGCA